MKGPVQNHRRRFLLLLAPLLLGSMAIPASRSDAEEEKKVSANTVAQGLKTIQDASEEIVKETGTDKVAAEKAVGVIAPVWSMIEGTIRANSQESYTALENALEELSAAAEAGDTKKAGGAAGAFTSAVNFYVAKFAADTPAPAAQKPGAEKQAAAAKAPAAKPTAAETPPAASGERTAASTTAAADTPEAAPSGTLARTGPATGLTALAGLALGLGGLAFMGGARRRP